MPEEGHGFLLAPASLVFICYIISYILLVEKEKEKKSLAFCAFSVACHACINCSLARWSERRESSCLTFTNLAGTGSYVGAEGIFRVARSESQAPDQ